MTQKDFAGSPVDKTLCSQCWRAVFDSWLGTKSHMHPAMELQAATKTQHSQNK